MGFIESCESGSMSGTAPRHHAPCEDGKETHGHSRSQPAERSGRHGGRRKGGREGAASFLRPHQEHPWEQEAGGGQPRSHAAQRSQRGSQGTAKTQHRGERAESERLNSFSDLIQQSCLNRNRADLQTEHRHVAWRGWFGPLS